MLPWLLPGLALAYWPRSGPNWLDRPLGMAQPAPGPGYTDIVHFQWLVDPDPGWLSLGSTAPGPAPVGPDTGRVMVLPVLVFFLTGFDRL